MRVAVRSTLHSLGFLLASLALSSWSRAQPPPGKGTDMELDPDAKPPPEEKKKDDLPPPEAGAWGVGGKDEEGKYAPGGHGGEKPDEKTPAGKELPPDELGPPGAGMADAVVGFGETRDVLNDANATSVTLVSFIFGLRYRFGKTVAFSMRMPIASGSVNGPQGGADDHKAFTVGNFEIAGRPTFQVTNRLRLPVGLALDIPVASGDPFPEANKLGEIPQWNMNYAAAATRGFEENALFASKRFGLIPSVGLLYDKQAIHAGLTTKLEMMFKTGGGDPPSSSSAKYHDPNTDWVTAVSFFYDLFGGKLALGLRTWLAVAALPLSSGTSEYSGVKWCAEPDLIAKLPLNEKGTIAVQGGVGYILPIAGNLGGNVSTGGVRADVALLF